jgi:hypothetical protein
MLEQQRREAEIARVSYEQDMERREANEKARINMQNSKSLSRRRC